LFSCVGFHVPCYVRGGPSLINKEHGKKRSAIITTGPTGSHTVKNVARRICIEMPHAAFCPTDCLKIPHIMNTRHFHSIDWKCRRENEGLAGERGGGEDGAFPGPDVRINRFALLGP